MSLPRFCEVCSKRYQPSGRYSRYCSRCVKVRRITSMFNYWGKFKDCNTLKEAISKYGSKT